MFQRQLQEATKVREVLIMQDLLNRLNDESIRSDFLNGRNGACLVDAAEMDFLERFAKSITPIRPGFSNEPSFASSVKLAADHLSFVVDGRTRQFLDSGFTYDKVKELFERVQSCSFWEKDIKIVETDEIPIATESLSVQSSSNEEEFMSSQQLDEPKEIENVQAPSAPAPTAVPTPTFNNNGGVMMPIQLQQQQQQQASMPGVGIPAQHQQQAPSNVPLSQTTVTAVENAYFNQLKYSQNQGSMINNGLSQPQPQMVQQQQPNPLHEVIASANFSFLQDSLLEIDPSSSSSPSNHSGSQQQHQKMPANVIQNYPPGLKLQQQSPHIPVNYQSNQQQAPSQVPSPHMIPKQQQQQQQSQPQQVSGNLPGPFVSGQNQAQRPYPSMVPTAQFQQQMQQNNNVQNLQNTLEKPSSSPNVDQLKSSSIEGSGSGGRTIQEKEKPRDDWSQQNNQQQPQIDTWTNETATGGTPQAGNNSNNYSSRSSGGGFNRRSENRAQGAGGAGKYGGYRSNGSDFRYILSDID